MNLLIEDNHDFVRWSTEHFIMLLTTLLLGIGFVRAGRRSDEAGKRRLAWIIFIAMLSSWLITFFVRVYLGWYDMQSDLPLHLCPIIVILAPWWLIYPRQFWVQTAYFLTLSGCAQALFSTNLVQALPNFIAIKYWVLHGFLVIGVFYAVLVYEVKPTLSGLVRSFGVFLTILAIVQCFNLILGTNYMFINHPPSTPSLLDHLGENPGYFIKGATVAFCIMFVLWVPFGLMKNKVNQ